ncbi:tetratricopeptide repeat protein [Methylophilus aquaticus]|uniref:Tetratricopeptide repeat protein n=1 Tax=Methylophilus aquaticus TaxID=1971610 RepID=A0ABT9JT65_9PROT|nr:tetratricopeptide repeat protein [Methylophilus aquaticus]MDP8567768.1 tetratricopeptide repeat protein [Methylophilus aquaticus]
MRKNYANIFLNVLIKSVMTFCLGLWLSACSTPEESAKSHLDSANAYLRDGNTKKAVLEFKNVLQIQPNSVPAIYGMALAFQHDNDWGKVYQFSLRVIELEPKHIDANLKLATLYMASNEMEKAMDRLSLLESLAPDNAEFLGTKSAFLFKSGDAKGAVDVASRALKLNPKNAQAIIILASESNTRGSYAETLTILDEGLKNIPEDNSLKLLRIETLEKNQQIADAQKELKKLINQYPDNLEYLKHLAYLHNKLGQVDQAEIVLKTIIKQKPDENAAIFDLIKYIRSTKGDVPALQVLDEFIAIQNDNAELSFFKVFFLNSVNRKEDAKKLLVQIAQNSSDLESAHKAQSMMAFNAFIAGNKSESIKLITQVLREDSRHVQALLLKAAIEMNDSDYKSAIADLRIILKDSPDNAPALVALAQAHETAGEKELSEKYFKRAADVSVTNTNFSLPYVEYLIRNNQLDQAKRAIEPILAANPKDPKVLKYMAAIKISSGDLLGAESIGKDIKSIDTQTSDQILGAVYVNQKNFDEGISALERNYASDPQNSEALLSLVKSLVNADRKAEAAKMLQQIVTNNPSNIRPKIMLAQVLIKMHDNNAAINQYRTIIKDHPDQLDAYQQLGELLADINRLGESKEVLNDGIKNVSNAKTLQLLLANVYQREGSVDNAINLYAEFLKIYPDSVVAKNNYISLVTDFKTDSVSLKKAYTLSRELKGSPSPYIQDTIGWIAFKVGQYDEARIALLKATDASPKTAIFFFHLGMAQASLADKDNAIISLETALKLKSANNVIPVDVINKKVNELKT